MYNKLNALIESLTPPQVKVLRTYLNAFAGRGDENTQLGRLFDALSAKPGMPAAYYSNLVYGKQNERALIRLSSRLYYKILDSLLIDINVNRLLDTEDENMMMVVLVRKMMLQYYILRLSAQTDEIGISLLHKAMAISEEYEYYPTQIEIIALLKAGSTAKGRKSTFANWEKKLELTKHARECYLRAFDWFNKYQELHNYQQNLSAAKHIEFLQKATKSLEEDYETSKSPTVKYFHGVLNVALLEHQGHFKEAITQCKSLLEHLNKFPAIYTRARISTQYSNIAVMEFHSGRLSEALKYNELSITVSLPHSIDMIYKLQQKAEILFYMGRWDEALRISDELIPTVPEHYQLLKAKTEILRAALLFSMKEYKQAAVLFGQKFILSADKAGWEIAVRILRIMSLVELEKKDEAETVFQNLLRYSQRTNHSFEISQRYKAIIKLLSVLSRAGFEISASNTKLLSQLESISERPELTWVYGTSELIAFDEWLRNKLRKKRGPKPGQKKKSNA
jgi:tetratricopeptide (TPR) repeat protein